MQRVGYYVKAAAAQKVSTYIVTEVILKKHLQRIIYFQMIMAKTPLRMVA